MQEKLSSTTARERIQTALQAVHGLTLLNGVLNGSTAQALLRLLTELSAPEPEPVATATAYSNAFRELAAAANTHVSLSLADAWQAYLIARLIDDSNIWSAQVERSGASGVTPTLRAQAIRDLRALHLLFALDAELIWNATCDIVTPALPILRNAWEPWCNLASAEHVDNSHARDTLAQQAAAIDDWSELASLLEKYWSVYGTGILARYHALRWNGVDKQLQGVTTPDPIQLSNLIGYAREQAILRANVERFLAGLPAHDVLLYGAPGTGKSSTVKALINTYSEHGLRLVEVSKEHIADLPGIVAQLRDRAPHYIIFVDDLSFEEHETEYKVLKVLLEGTAEARPTNILIHSTTNRLNLIKENFVDRGKPTQDVHWRDTMDEKHSLAHRFGLRLTFISPDQAHYLAIVDGLASQRGLKLAAEELHSRALLWERQHIGRSGRVARQFIDDLEAELGALQHKFERESVSSPSAILQNQA
ncbi:ATP-binding protein [Ktedonosporobacter rubrisoli]|uniref:ATP-binding protein n=1 Tax=Ktedonosporobacter rubrisoli TaxID=2509675 RepID=A0A4P6K5G6_KTERU|nr:ATP-binding protein [Ktedonosporobacter rubrisoli]QBD83203.1 ATP-binding protein [Ktedonosporobacter rubrisoli]